jgi:hypothetical protein
MLAIGSAYILFSSSRRRFLAFIGGEGGAGAMEGIVYIRFLRKFMDGS